MIMLYKREGGILLKNVKNLRRKTTDTVLVLILIVYISARHLFPVQCQL
jgi:hypothetical protein